MKQLLLVILSTVSFFSCTKSGENVAGAAYFPNSIGNYWRYKYIDSITQKASFVDVKIVGTKTLSGGNLANIWVYTFSNYSDTSFVYQIADTVRFVDKNMNIQNTYVLPFVLNKRWATYPDFSNDSCKVVDNRSFTLNNHVFDNSYLLSRSGQVPNSYWNRVEWFCPNIGMITRNERSLFTIANEHTNTYWELISYQLK